MTTVALPLPGWPPRSPRGRPRTRLWAFLAAALALHAVLIALPVRLGGPAAPERPALAVTLSPTEAAAPEAPAPETERRPEPQATDPAPPESEALPEEALPVAPTTATARTGPVSENATPPAPTAPGAEPATEAPPAPAQPALTTATLLHTVGEGSWRTPLLPDEPPAATRRGDDAWPRSWNRPVLPRQGNLFDDAVLPTETEIVDRWRAADGAHEVVVRTPGGDTLCGRAMPYNPLEPLVEPIMVFRLCAGGGKRSFKPGVVPDER